MMLGVVVVATATEVVCAISDSFLILSAEYLRKWCKLNGKVLAGKWLR